MMMMNDEFQTCKFKPQGKTSKPGKTRVQALCAFAEEAPAGFCYLLSFIFSFGLMEVPQKNKNVLVFARDTKITVVKESPLYDQSN